MTDDEPREELLLRDQIKAAMRDTAEKLPPEPQATNDAPAPQADRREVRELSDAPAPAAPKPAPKPAAAKPPESWTAPMKAKFASLEPEMQQEILRRESDMHRLATRHDEERHLGRRIKELSQPYMAVIHAEGGDTAQAYNQFLNTAYLLRTGTPAQKTMLLHQLAQQFQVNLSTPLQPAAAASPEIVSLREQVARLEAARQADVRTRQQHHGAQMAGTLAEFASDPNHVHFEQVRAHMAALLQSGAAKDLAEAYEQACWANPDIRALLAADAEQKRLSEVKSRADAARRASVSISGAPGSAAPSTIAERSLRDELKANLRAAQGRI